LKEELEEAKGLDQILALGKKYNGSITLGDIDGRTAVIQQLGFI